MGLCPEHDENHICGRCASPRTPIKSEELTLHDAQHRQPWTVPYHPDFERVQMPGSGRLAYLHEEHAVLHAMKSVGKLAALYERLHHRGGVLLDAEANEAMDMAADLLTVSLRLANLLGRDLAAHLMERVAQKNGVGY